jgi:hypothetical protein
VKPAVEFLDLLLSIFLQLTPRAPLPFRDPIFIYGPIVKLPQGKDLRAKNKIAVARKSRVEDANAIFDLQVLIDHI